MFIISFITIRADRGEADIARTTPAFQNEARAGERTGIRSLLNTLGEAGLSFRDLQTTQSSLEDIFVDLVNEEKP